LRSNTLALLLPYLVGYGFSLLGPLAPPWRIGSISARIWKSLGGAEPNQETRLPSMVGCVERALYTTSYIFGNEAFIGTWLVLKVAGSWGGWAKGYKGVEGRAMYQTFLIGTGLSLAYGVLGARLIEWIGGGFYAVAGWSAAALIGGNAALWLWVKEKFPLPFDPSTCALGPGPTHISSNPSVTEPQHALRELPRKGK